MKWCCHPPCCIGTFEEKKFNLLLALAAHALRFTDLRGYLCTHCLFTLKLFYYQLYMVINGCQDRTFSEDCYYSSSGCSLTWPWEITAAPCRSWRSSNLLHLLYLLWAKEITTQHQERAAVNHGTLRLSRIIMPSPHPKRDTLKKATGIASMVFEGFLHICLFFSPQQTKKQTRTQQTQFLSSFFNLKRRKIL